MGFDKPDDVREFYFSVLSFLVCICESLLPIMEISFEDIFYFIWFCSDVPYEGVTLIGPLGVMILVLGIDGLIFLLLLRSIAGSYIALYFLAYSAFYNTSIMLLSLF